MDPEKLVYGDRTTIGVLIGRFQTDELHKGHTKLLDAVTKMHARVLILLGTPPKYPNSNNPLSFIVRERMLRGLAPNAVITPVVDCRNDEEWSRQVDKLIDLMYPETPAILYGGRDSFIPHYRGKHTCRELNFGMSGTSGTNRRADIAVTVLDSADFRAGIIHCMETMPPRLSPCVDIAVIDKDRTRVLLGRKLNERLYRFPGGRVTKADASYEVAACREVFEETGVRVIGFPKYVGSFTIPDWRGADISAFFVVENWTGVVAAGDDISDVYWMEISSLVEEMLVTEHKVLLGSLKSYLN